jgi:3,4-dihydroxy 2-butanone 4-phosphate synthase/GTP cyclohydrolase II
MEFARIEQAIKALQQGKMILVTDDEDRENEGDLICAAQYATTENINFMASHAKGLICMPMSRTLAEKLALPPMVSHNTDNHETAFTVSIDYKATTTGISAEERGMTARMCADDKASAADFRRPGHMFPLIANNNGVLARNGHTEATVDFMRLAGLKECGVCCEIMQADGTMMRKEELKEFSQRHKLAYTTIRELQAYRKVRDKLVECVAVTAMPTGYGQFTAYCYINKLNGEHHVALVAGDITEGKDILCRMHSECLTGDVFGSLRCDCGQQFDAAMQMIGRQGRGIMLYMRQEGRGIGLVNKLKAYHLQDGGRDTLEANLALGFEGDMRDYFIAAQILRDLGIESLHLLTNNPNKIDQLENYGIKITERIAIEVPATAYDRFYLETKQLRMGHMLNITEEK